MVLGDECVEQLYVHPAWYGHGLGLRLLELAKRERSILDLWTFQSNAGARRFYERHGFVAVAMTEGDNEEGAPDIRHRTSGTTGIGPSSPARASASHDH